MNKRMTIARYTPNADPISSDGLAPMPPMPPRDGTIRTSFIGKQIQVDAYCSDSLVTFAKTYARTCLVAQDMEIDVLKTERDALLAQLKELRGC